MALKTLSLLLYAAYHSLQPCETVFVETAKAANPTVDFTAEQSMLEEFAQAACQTSNPDVLWLIAQQESNFRFTIASVNSENPKLYKGNEAKTYLKSLRGLDREASPNVDIGVLQFNWMWHQGGFNKDPLAALSPRNQVDYFLRQFGKEIYRRCDDQWVGCYHNQTNSDRANRYQQAVAKKGKVLALRTLYFLRDHRNAISDAEKRLMPAIQKDEFYRVFESVQGFPLPQKQILHFVDERPSLQQLPREISYEG